MIARRVNPISCNVAMHSSDTTNSFTGGAVGGAAIVPVEEEFEGNRREPNRLSMRGRSEPIPLELDDDGKDARSVETAL